MKKKLLRATGNSPQNVVRLKPKLVTKFGPVTPQGLWAVMEKHAHPSALADSLMAEDAPPWVRVLAKKWLRHQQAGIPIKPGMETDPAFLGAQTARAVVARKLGQGEVELTDRVRRDLDQFVKVTRLTKAAIRDAADRTEEEIAEQAAYVDEAMPLVTRMKEQEQERFMRAYNKALKLGIEYLDPTRVPVEHKIVQILFFNWRLIARLSTVSQVHQFLGAVFARTGVIISRDRIAQRCRRIGLRFCGPGRPRKLRK
ncbi:MAG: hypothetical protein HZA92_04500 [Verrucomicrobia bacterium]|nr:hypothetical protein [Verrucomicrobiota bacterium]